VELIPRLALHLVSGMIPAGGDLHSSAPPRVLLSPTGGLGFSVCARLTAGATRCPCDSPGRDRQAAPGCGSMRTARPVKKGVCRLAARCLCRETGSRVVRGPSPPMVRRGRLGTTCIRNDAGWLSERRDRSAAVRSCPSDVRCSESPLARGGAWEGHVPCCGLLQQPHSFDRVG
jgi:hypothetical protein